ncbi:MAG: hypothetical protein ABSH33_19085 [Steroidobacteraceae bacterium]|jgi:hypothetical protein
MNTVPSYIDTRIPREWSVPQAPSCELEPQQIEALVHGARQPSADEHELIEMRYQQLMARVVLEEFFCEAQMGTH